MHEIPGVSIDDLIERYETLLFDAYGVLVHRDGPLPGAVGLLNRLLRLGKPFYLVTNTAARLPEKAAERYQTFGLPLLPEQIITSGSLIGPHLKMAGLQGCRCAVLGPEDSFRYVELGGATPVAPTEDFDVLLIGDQVGFPFLESVDAVLSRLIKKLDQGNLVPLILPNPDLIYPKPSGFGMTSGCVAMIIEGVLAQRYPNQPGIRFVHLGKPEPAIFAEAARRAGTRKLVMIGDQLETDIRGAARFGIDSAFITGGVSALNPLPPEYPWRPTYWLASLEAEAFTP